MKIPEMFSEFQKSNKVMIKTMYNKLYAKKTLYMKAYIIFYKPINI